MTKEVQNSVNINGMEVKAEFINTEREFKWRLVSGYETSDWSSHYQGLLVHTFKNGRKFALATDYWNGTLVVELPFEIVETDAAVVQTRAETDDGRWSAIEDCPECSPLFLTCDNPAASFCSSDPI